jgi:signal transduction histidine kinase
VGVALYDLEGHPVVAPQPIPKYCERRCTKHGEQARCDSTKKNVALPLSFDDRQEIRGCFTGFKYYGAQVRSGMDAVGVAVLGPFQDAASKDFGDPPEGASAADKEELARMRAGVRSLAPDEAARLATFTAGTIELFLFASLKSYLAAKVHLESVNDSFRELQAKNRELRSSFEKLKALDVMKSNFLATVSHELRTPLTSIIGYAEMVMEGIGGKIPAGAKKHVELIVAKGEQLLELINSVLDMSKIESGRMELSIDRVALEEIVEDALNSVRPQAQKKDVKLSSKVEGARDLLADKYKLRQILVNLLSNAVKFTPEAGRVKITARRTGGRGPEGRVVITVSDTGIGIPAEQQAKIFERFYQVDNSSTRQYGGTGLGLPIVRSFVEMHGGTIRVESEAGKGTTFVVEIPVTPPPRGSKPALT